MHEYHLDVAYADASQPSRAGASFSEELSSYVIQFWPLRYWQPVLLEAGEHEILVPHPIMQNTAGPFLWSPCLPHQIWQHLEVVSAGRTSFLPYITLRQTSHNLLQDSSDVGVMQGLRGALTGRGQVRLDLSPC